MTTLYVDNIAPNLASKISAPDIQLPSGSVLQVVQARDGAKTNYTLNNTFSTHTPLNTAITPSSTNSKILVRVVLYVSTDGATNPYPAFKLQRNGSDIDNAIGDSGYGSRRRVSGGAGFSDSGSPSNTWVQLVSAEFLDSPASTDEQTYSVAVIGYDNRIFTINGTGASDGSSGAITISTVTLMEIAG
jgi:hypothetical protein